MKPARRSRISPSLVVAVVAVVLASTGSAVAARLITSKDIRNGTIQAADLSRSARDALSSRRGPRGAEGPPGVQGPAGSPQAEAWSPLQLATGWANHGGGWEHGGYRRDPASGRVDLRGLIAHLGTPSGGSLITTLPPGYRPRNGQLAVTITGRPEAVGHIQIHPDGRILWVTGAVNADDYTSLSGISFWTD